MPFDDAAAHGEPDARAGIVFPGMQPLKDFKNAVGVLRIDSDAIVLYRESPQVFLALRADLDARRRLAVELDAVADQVLKQLAELGFVATYHRKPFVLDAGIVFFDRRA